ncbi:phosphate ABC transporter substrate-binding protein [Trichocoleus sp. FACHB-262]|uniref:phosphate ABC transporter substrate-binding protein n=1 Tax=Trichocoleus sp. FACHB-262 TaxID=2692869 RepID=UPI00168517B2|nr:phosphate ABC transporter substrate-binding protein [Trichocoleus sp. FACHB-262]MBD2120542.1 phosphate ABC transporter substrate-binding protein [Trichocoleus sp. FACHB-262]
MTKIVEILLRAFLRRYPVPTRLSFFSYLGRYAWLKDVLEELRPELFPSQQTFVEVAVPEGHSESLDPRILGILEQAEIRGRLGYYKVEAYLGPRGNGHLFEAIEVTSKRSVVIKEFLLLASDFSHAEVLQRQNSFKRLAGIQLADGRVQDFRAIQPLEAIADTESYERCFLVTDTRDLAPTLRQYLQLCGILPSHQVREILSQILQTLDFLHNQKFSFPAGAVQKGLIHGNLSLDSILWIEQSTSGFVYLCDLLLWEQCFDAAIPPGRSTQATNEAIQKDLKAVGQIGMQLLQGGQPDGSVVIEPALREILQALQSDKFASAEVARCELLQLISRSPTAIAPVADIPAQTTPSSRFSPLLLIPLLGLMAGSFLLLPRLRPTEARLSPSPQLSTCCLSEVSAVPTGEYIYTSLRNGTWWSLLQQHNLLQGDQHFTDVLSAAQPNLRLQYLPANSFAAAVQQVRSGAADFAILPPVNELPADLLSQEIAYDGLAVVVSFSYTERQQGLPTTLKGKLSLDQVRQLFSDPPHDWTTFGGPNLQVQRYAPQNPEAIALFEQQVLKQSSQSLTDVQQLPPMELLRQVIRDFEVDGLGSVGFIPLSEIWGQCSVYPLALSQARKAAVQPLVLSDRQEITPETDLCNRKGAYAPDPVKFQTSEYPLSYPILVIYPRDNRRSAPGKKFVELMRTLEGQRLLKTAGLVPLSGNLASPQTPAPPPSL